jgi:isopenicillin-N N-acyltransferase like protein
MTKKTLKMIDVGGSHLEIGRQIGEACAEQIRNSIENGHKLIHDAHDELHLNWKGARIQARKYIPFAEERYPKYVDEMRGIAEGADVKFDDIAVLNVMEGVVSDALHLTKCTSFAVNQERTENGQVLVAHNEDWVPEDEQDVFIIRARPDDEPAFLAMTYGGLLPNIGMNAEGIAQCCDSVTTTDKRIGIPRIIVSRAVLAARTPSQAIRSVLIPHRAAGYNHLLVHESGELYSVEVSARNFALLYGSQGYMVHTNHFLDRKMEKIEAEPDELINTRVRYWRAHRLIQQTKQHSTSSLQNILKDHVNYPDSICRHDNQGSPLEREKTIISVVMDLTHRQLHAAWGNPCETEYQTFSLDTPTSD